MIQLTDDLWMDADDHCYIVGKPWKRRRGVVELRMPTYYSTAEQAVYGALGHAMRKAVKDGSITTLRQFIQEQERLRSELENLIAPVRQ